MFFDGLEIHLGTCWCLEGLQASPGALWGPLGRQGGPNKGSGREKLVRWTPPGPPSWSQNCQTMVEKTIPNSTSFSITCFIDFGAFLEPIWSDFGFQNAARIGPESVPRAIMRPMQKSPETLAAVVFLMI